MTTLGIFDRSSQKIAPKADINLKSFEAMRMHETFQQIYQAKTRTDFEQLLSKWDNWVSQCNLPAMVETSKAIKTIGKALCNGN